MNEKQYELIIFDCDGTLVDSEHLCLETISHILFDIGYSNYDLAYAVQHFMGMAIEDIQKHIHLNGHSLDGRFKSMYDELLSAELKVKLNEPIKGVDETLNLLKGKVKLCVASNGEHDHIHICINNTGLSKYFKPEDIFVKDMVKAGKPAPDLFLLTAEKMGTKPDKVMVIEDSEAGIKAAKAAGMAAVGFTGVYRGNKTKWAKILKKAGAINVVDNFQDILLSLND